MPQASGFGILFFSLFYLAVRGITILGPEGRVGLPFFFFFGCGFPFPPFQFPGQRLGLCN
jgi:hypothetical protein